MSKKNPDETMEDELIDYDQEDDLAEAVDHDAIDAVDAEPEETNKSIAKGDEKKQDEKPKGSYATLADATFKDMLLNPELNRALGDAGFEHPS